MEKRKELEAIQALLFEMQQIGIDNLGPDEWATFEELHNRQRALMQDLYTFTTIEAST
jgi:hypothetical protein